MKFVAYNVQFKQSKFRPFTFKEFSVQKPQIWVLFQSALLFHCMLYTIAQVAGPLLSRVTWALLKLIVFVASMADLHLRRRRDSTVDANWPVQIFMLRSDGAASFD